MSRAFDTAYADGGVPTWDIGRPQPAVTRLVESGAFGVPGARVLDAGCGTGEHALLLAAAGYSVVGVDVAAEAIRRARAKAAQRTPTTSIAPAGGPGVAPATSNVHPGAPRFLVHDALDLPTLVAGEGGPFDVALDIGLFHTLSDAERRRYAGSLAAAVRPGGCAFVLCWADRNPFGFGPRRLTRREIRATFRASAGWRVDRIDAEELQSRLPAWQIHAWLAHLARRP